MNKQRWLAIGLVALGMLQMAGELLSVMGFHGVGAATAGVAAATCASPAPKVFSAVRGLETYSTCFFLEWTRRDGEVQSIELTPQRYARLKGPYNRRNVYGAALAYGPVLATNVTTRAMWEAVINRALCGSAPLLVELGLDAGDRVGPVRVRYVSVSRNPPGNLPDILEPTCQ